MKLSKHILAGFLMLLLAAPGISISFLESQKFFRQLYMREALEKRELSTITIPKLYWIIKNKEILVEGRMFDVKSVKFTDGNYIVRGFYDDKEKEIRNIISNIERKERNTEQSTLLFKGFAIYELIFLNYSLAPPVYYRPSILPFLFPAYTSATVGIILQPPRTRFYV